MAVMVDDSTRLRAAIGLGIDHPSHRGTGWIGHVKVETPMERTRHQIGHDQKYGHNPAQSKNMPQSRSDPTNRQ
jgi:hypothetical protein